MPICLAYEALPRSGLVGLEVPRRASIAGFGKLESAFSTWDIFYQHHDNKDKSNIFKTSGYKGLFWVRFWDLKLVLCLAEVEPPLHGLCMERGKIA